MKKMNFEKKALLFLRSKNFLAIAILILTAVSGVFAQQTTGQNPQTKPTPDVSAAPAPDKKDAGQTPAAVGNNVQLAEAEKIAESVIFIYGGGLGRINLDQIRKTTLERGKMTMTDAAGKTEQANYERWVLRGENLEKERVRFDKEFPNTKFALISNGDKVFGIYNNAVFTPREDAVKEFQNRIWHGLEALLRYKENGSSVELVKRDKIMGVEFNILDVTDKGKRKTRFYVSVKSFRVMMLEFTEDSVNYRRKFYDYNYAQGTLVPYRTVLWADDKKVEEMNVQTITFGQRVEDDLFAANQK